MVKDRVCCHSRYGSMHPRGGMQASRGQPITIPTFHSVQFADHGYGHAANPSTVLLLL